MIQIRQLSKKMMMILKYIVFYQILSFLIILIFALVYYLIGVKYPIDYSFNIFLKITSDFAENASVPSKMEYVANDLFNIIVASTILLKFLTPLNPIIISENVVFNSIIKKFSFCYWIMLPEGKFLFDINIRIFLTTRTAHQEGINSIKVKWQSNDKSVTNLKLARGIRYARLNKKESRELDKIIQMVKKDNSILKKDNSVLKKDYELNFVISGDDSVGNRFYAWKKYEIDDICYGYQFVPLQEHEYTSKAFLAGDEDGMNSDNTKICRKELFRYQHFGKICALDENMEKKYILTEKWITEGQYNGLRQKFLDFFSWITMLFLDRSHWKAWWKSDKPSYDKK